MRRGTDVFKALALGAKAVGIGRPVLYGMAAYGQDGVERVLQIFKVQECGVMIGGLQCVPLGGTRCLHEAHGYTNAGRYQTVRFIFFFFHNSFIE